MTQDSYVEMPSQEAFQRVADVAQETRYSGIREVLTRWGNWAREQPRVGYPKFSAGMGQNPVTDKVAMCSDEEGLVIDKAVLALKGYSEEHFKAIVSKYVVGATGKGAAEYLGIPVRQYYITLSSAEMALSVALLTTVSIFEA